MGSRPKNDVVREPFLVVSFLFTRLQVLNCHFKVIKSRLQVRDAFTNCQDSFAVHPKLIKRLKTYYEKNDPDRQAHMVHT